MTPQTAQLRRSRPSYVDTDLPPSTSQHQHPLPVSAVSTSSVASSSQQGSPLMSPSNALVTSNSSLQPSPEPPRGRGIEEPLPTAPFQLPEPVLSRKTSNNSLGTSLMSSPGAMSDVMKGPGLMRRLSNRVPKLSSRRRQSSVAPNSRDGSVGPGMLRRRSDSNATAPPDFAALMTDSEDDFVDDKDDLGSLLSLDGIPKESSSNSATASVAGSTTASITTAGPVVPFQLYKGTWIRKVSKKNRRKRFILVLEQDNARITWDKARPNKCVYIDDIKEIRSGSDIRQYRLDFGLSESEESRWFSILHVEPDKGKTKIMHLIADDATTFYNWVTTLEAISKHRQDLMASLMSFNERAVRDFWKTEMAKQLPTLDEETIDFPGVERVCRNLHIHASPSQLFAKFHLADTDNTKHLNYSDFQKFVGFMKHREDIRSIYKQIASNPDAGLTSQEFLSFLRDVQGEDVDNELAVWEGLYSKFSRKTRQRDAEKHDAALLAGEVPRMNDAAFAAFLTSLYNLPLVQEPKEYTLDRPLNEYYISSSHNTYLLGRQVAGLSSVEGYITALVHGCRCVEVDCWDGADGQPTVNHGRTLTTSISFQEAMTTINKYAFSATHYPLWISLEVHCNPQQQAIMAKIIKDTFGARLVTEPLDPSSDKLPSPEELKDRVLIKVKRPQMKEEPKSAEPTGRRRGNSLNSPYLKPTIVDAAVAPSQSLPQSPMLSPSQSTRRLVNKSRVNTITEGEVHDTMSSSTSDNDSAGERPAVAKRSSNKTIKVLGDLGVYCAGVKFRGFDDPDARSYNHIFSFMESSFWKNSRAKDSKQAMCRHNMRHLMRVYPDLHRFTSNNFDPLMYWRRGVQMAALNWQTFDLGMQLNQAMFQSGTDRSGYVLKPSQLREIRVMREGWSGKRERKEVAFSIDVISAQQLMRPNNMSTKQTVDPYVEIEVFHANDRRDKKGAEVEKPTAADTPTKVVTRIIPENGFNPIFDGKFNFKVTTKYPELIFVRFSVKLSQNGESYNDRQPVAVFAAKLLGLKQGYRTLPLFNNNGDQYLFSTLFCRVKVDSIQDVLLDCPNDPPDNNSNKLREIGRMFSRSNTSPKSSMEKSSFDGSL